MTLLERLLRGIRAACPEVQGVRIELAHGSTIPTSLPEDLLRALPLEWCRDGGSPIDRLQSVLRDAAGEPVIALCADSVVDTRLLEHLGRSAGNVAFTHGEGEERAAILRLENELRTPEPVDGGLSVLAERAVKSGIAKELAESDFDDYIPNLRRSLEPYVFRIANTASLRRVERFLFWSNYKGSTDFLTKYVYPPLVWATVRPLARRRVHPNVVTAVDWIATFAAVPLFAAGAWLPGLFLAYAMSVLDSVDGKLARLTYTSSRFGEIFDHGLDIVHPPVWYMAWAWALGGGVFDSGVFQASLWLLGFYVADRLCALIFKVRTGRSIHGASPLDERVRPFVSRRNVNFLIFTAAVFFDWIVPGYSAQLCSLSSSSLSGRWSASSGTRSASFTSGAPAPAAEGPSSKLR
jgi:phosphatidylglycerophosphate synthase